MYLVYSILFTLGLILTAPYYLWRLRGKIISGAGWRERFGRLPASLQQDAPGAIWIHAVSVGETLAVTGLVRKLERLYPERKIFLSHVTPAGRLAGENGLRTVAGRFYLPLDWKWAVRRTLGRIRPALLLIVETELWPNLLRATHASGARIVLVNARLSDRSFRRYQRFRSFLRRVLAEVDHVCAQSARDADRFRQLGMAPERVTVTGNMKFDGTPPTLGQFSARLQTALGRAQRAPVLVAGSTMPGEEALLLPAWNKIRIRHPRALLILAPRHPARFDAVGSLLDGHGKSYVRRTALEPGEEGLVAQLASPEILLLDTIGELAGVFEVADLVFMGGSLVPTGGHNVLEPAYWGKPILFGPYMHNFRDIARLFVEAGAAVPVRDAADLMRNCQHLLQDEVRCQQLGAMAKRLLARESGATGRVVKKIEEILNHYEGTSSGA
jgi:3-deoxy-D-manno-octulosonic-acid transferase